MSAKPPNPLDQAQELFEAGSVNDAARLLHRVRAWAAARSRDDVLADADDLVSQMQAYLKGDELDAFDALVAHGEPDREKQPPSGGAAAVAGLIASCEDKKPPLTTQMIAAPLASPFGLNTSRVSAVPNFRP